MIGAGVQSFPDESGDVGGDVVGGVGGEVAGGGGVVGFFDGGMEGGEDGGAAVVGEAGEAVGGGGGTPGKAVPGYIAGFAGTAPSIIGTIGRIGGTWWIGYLV